MFKNKSQANLNMRPNYVRDYFPDKTNPQSHQMKVFNTVDR
eukprot:UN18163